MSAYLKPLVVGWCIYLISFVNWVNVTERERIDLEFSTYRWREHCGYSFDNDIGYRTQDEFLEWQAKDPLLLLESSLSQSTFNLSQQLDGIKAVVNLEVQAAFKFAETSEFPLQSEAYQDVYATQELSA